MTLSQQTWWKSAVVYQVYPRSFPGWSFDPSGGDELINFRVELDGCCPGFEPVRSLVTKGNSNSHLVRMNSCSHLANEFLHARLMIFVCAQLSRRSQRML